jgi:hypothetical protein
MEGARRMNDRMPAFFKGFKTVEWILVGIVAAEALFFLWLYVNPNLLRKTETEVVAAPGTQQIQIDQAQGGGGLALPNEPQSRSGTSDGYRIQGYMAGDEVRVNFVISAGNGIDLLAAASSTDAA